jgi:hypothetical protein
VASSAQFTCDGLGREVDEQRSGRKAVHDDRDLRGITAPEEQENSGQSADGLAKSAMTQAVEIN